VEASHWFARAAEHGSAAAELNLGALYANGRGVPLNYVEAYKWFSLAEAKGFKLAAQAKESIRTIMTERQLTTAETRLHEWRQQHSAIEDVPGGQ
jgi:TPR repeat protein